MPCWRNFDNTSFFPLNTYNKTLCKSSLKHWNSGQFASYTQMVKYSCKSIPFLSLVYSSIAWYRKFLCAHSSHNWLLTWRYGCAAPIMDKSLGTLLHFWGVFHIHTGPAPPLTPQQPRSFPVFQLCIEWGKGKLQEISKGCTVLRGNREWQKNMNIAVLSQGLMSRIVVRSSSAHVCCHSILSSEDFRRLPKDD